MITISNIIELRNNLKTVENYLKFGSPVEEKEIKGLIQRGICFVAYKINDSWHFAPSKFIGYKDNTLNKHQPAKMDGRITNKEINRIIGYESLYNDVLEDEYLGYCNKLGIKPHNKNRKYWKI